MNPTLDALRQAGRSASIGEITELVIQGLSLPDNAINETHNGGHQSELEYRLAWARTYLKQYGLITNSARGVWTLTPRGKETPTVNPDDVVREVSLAKRQSRQTSGQASGDVEDTDNEIESWRKQLIATVLKMPQTSFEHLCQLILEKSGFSEVTITGCSDHGIGGYGVVGMRGLVGFPVHFQCKRSRSSVTSEHVYDFRRAIAGNSDKGLLITTGRFARDAREEAAYGGAPPIDLIDGDLLAEKLKVLELGVKTEMVEQVTVDASFFEGI